MIARDLISLKEARTRNMPEIAEVYPLPPKCLAIILVHSHDIGKQVYDEAIDIYKGTGINVLFCRHVKGNTPPQNIDEINAGYGHIAIMTMGRFLILGALAITKQAAGPLVRSRMADTSVAGKMARRQLPTGHPYSAVKHLIFEEANFFFDDGKSKDDLPQVRDMTRLFPPTFETHMVFAVDVRNITDMGKYRGDLDVAVLDAEEADNVCLESMSHWLPAVEGAPVYYLKLSDGGKHLTNLNVNLRFIMAMQEPDTDTADEPVDERGYIRVDSAMTEWFSLIKMNVEAAERKKMPKTFIIFDAPRIVSVFKRWLEGQGFGDVVVANHGKEDGSKIAKSTSSSARVTGRSRPNSSCG
jgi:hypothetical protein